MPEILIIAVPVACLAGPDADPARALGVRKSGTMPCPGWPSA
jgi:hypothetical protein